MADIVAFPTETVYGLGVDAENEAAVAQMYQVKGRPASHPVIVHISNQNQVEYWAQDVPIYAIALMRKFWPGPMTLILKRSEQAKDFVTGGQDYVGLPIPLQWFKSTIHHKAFSLGRAKLPRISANKLIDYRHAQR